MKVNFSSLGKGDFGYLFSKVLDFKFGKKTVIIPIKGKKAQTEKTYDMLVSSASFPNKAEPMPPNPKESPKNNPAMVPTFPGSNSVPYTKIAEKAEEIIRPMRMAKMMVHCKSAYGSMRVKGAAPRMETHITSFLPYLSPIGPPRIVPAATAAKKAKR